MNKQQLKRILREVMSTEPLVLQPAVEEDHSVYGHGGSAKKSKSQLFHIAKDATELHSLLDDEDELPEWVQSKIAVMEYTMNEVLDHIYYKAIDKCE